MSERGHLGGRRRGRQPAEQAGEPRSKSFLLPRLKRKKEVQPAASKAGTLRKVHYFCSFLCKGKKHFAKELDASLRSGLGSGRPPPPEAPSYELPLASTVQLWTSHGSEDPMGSSEVRGWGLLSDPGAGVPPTGRYTAHPLTSGALPPLLSAPVPSGVGRVGLTGG